MTSVHAPEPDWKPSAVEARALCGEAERLLADARTLLGEHAQVAEAAKQALWNLRTELARARLGSIPVSRLRDVTAGRLRIGALERAGITTVLQVLQATPYELQLLPGIGPQTALQIRAAAEEIERAAAEAAGVRIDVERRDPATTALVIALHRLVNAGPDLSRALAAARDLDGRLARLLADARPARRWLRMLLAGPRRRRRAREALAELKALLGEARETRLLLTQATTDLLRPPASEFEAWADFEIRSTEYHALLAELAGEPVTAGHGLLPDDLVAKVEAQELDGTHRRVSLRGYQAFGARFALAQRRVILGDEMGLGKTVQAIAAMAHLKAKGGGHFLVVCPTSVLVNWVREIESRSTLRAFPLHGPDRAAALDEWVRLGGVAVATLDGLARLRIPPSVPLAMLVVDEAHYVKNPQAKRSQAVAAWCRRTEPGALPHRHADGEPRGGIPHAHLLPAARPGGDPAHQ